MIMKELRLSEDELKHLTPLAARDIVVRCFCAAQSLSTPPDVIAHHRGQLGLIFAALPEAA